MPKLLIAALFFLALAAAGCTSSVSPVAGDDGTAYAWCTDYMYDGTNCGFTNLQQCLDTSTAGTRGLCYPNGRYRSEPGADSAAAN